MVTSSVASTIGGLNLFFEIILSAIIGIYILQNFKFSLVDSINDARSGKITQDEFIKTNVAKAIGAGFLIVPGVFTDIIGVLLQFGFLTMVFTKIFDFKKENRYQQNKDEQYYRYETHYKYENKGVKDEEIIDVEVIDDNKSIKH